MRRLIPVTSTGLTPTRVTSCWATIAQTIEVPATAMYAIPVFIAEYPSTCCMYSVSIRNIEQRRAEDEPCDVGTRDRLDPEDRERHQRVLGAGLHPTKATSSATAAAKMPIVLPDDQP